MIGSNGSEVCCGSEVTLDSDPHENNRKKRVTASKRWCFTWHNYSTEDINLINGSFGSKISCLVFSEERGDSDETPHLQGYLELVKKGRPIECLNWNKEVHWEKAKGTKEQNMAYISKEGGAIYVDGRILRKPKILSEDKLWVWQTELLEIIKSEPDDRTIYWFWEKEGNSGKSAFTKMLCAKYGAMICNGKASDIKYGIIKFHEKYCRYPDCIVVDLPRSFDTDYLNFSGIEDIKNGCFFSTKYECEQVVMPCPHIVIFSNQEPPTGKLSMDRWKIHEIKKAECW